MVFPRGIRLDRLENVPGATDLWGVIVVSRTVSICLSGCRDLNSGPSVPQIDAPQTVDLRKRPETPSGLLF